MDWVPDSGWLTQMRIDGRASDLRYDLAVDATGRGVPSRQAAGIDLYPPIHLEGVGEWGAVAVLLCTSTSSPDFFGKPASWRGGSARRVSI